MPKITIELSPQDLAQLKQDTDIIIKIEKDTNGRVENSGEAPWSFIDFFRHTISNIEMSGHQRTAETYRTTLNSFQRFLESISLSACVVDAQLMDSYEQHLKRRGLVKNTISFYMRIMRAVYNRAVEAGLTADTRPFRNVYTGIAKTTKRAVPLSVIQALSQLQLCGFHAFARDMFLFSFFTRGMSFIDMAYLRKTNLQNACLHYRRKKTGQQIHIRWIRQMQQIVDRHPTGDSPYLLPIIRRNNGRERSQYRNCLTQVNAALRQLSPLLKIEQPITMYVARHSWASIARELSVPISVISEGMGHDSEQTTQIYLKTLDTSKIDMANAQIAEAVGAKEQNDSPTEEAMG